MYGDTISFNYAVVNCWTQHSLGNEPHPYEINISSDWQKGRVSLGPPTNRVDSSDSVPGLHCR